MQPKVYIIVGPARTGKSLCVQKMRDNHIPVYCVTVTRNDDLCFDGYSGEQNIVLDDCAPSVRLVDLCKLTKNYCHPTIFPVKGGFVHLPLNRTIWLISNVMPVKWKAFRNYPDRILTGWGDQVTTWMLWSEEDKKYLKYGEP
jgi:hypothetical protein